MPHFKREDTLDILGCEGEIKVVSVLILHLDDVLRKQDARIEDKAGVGLLVIRVEGVRYWIVVMAVNNWLAIQLSV